MQQLRLYLGWVCVCVCACIETSKKTSRTPPKRGLPFDLLYMICHYGFQEESLQAPAAVALEPSARRKRRSVLRILVVLCEKHCTQQNMHYFSSTLGIQGINYKEAQTEVVKERRSREAATASGCIMVIYGNI